MDRKLWENANRFHHSRRDRFLKDVLLIQISLMVSTDMTEDFKAMAVKREHEAEQITDDDVFINVCLKVSRLDVSTKMKVDILMQSIPKISKIFGSMQALNKKGVLSNGDYHDLLEGIIERMKEEGVEFNYDPLEYTND